MITQEALERTLELQRTDGRRLGTLLVEQGLINETQLTQILSHQLAVPWVSLLHIEFSRQLLNLVPHDVAERYCLVPIYVRHVRNQGETLYVAMDDPTNEDGMKECMAYSGLPVRAMIAPPSDIRNAIRVYYGARARSAPPPAPARQQSAEQAPRTRQPEARASDAARAPEAARASNAARAPENAKSSEEVSSTPQPLLLTRPATRSGTRPADDGGPAIETTEVDATEVSMVDDEDGWDDSRAASQPSAPPRSRPEERARPASRAAPSSESPAATPSDRRKTLRPGTVPDVTATPLPESLGADGGAAQSTPAAALLGAVLGRTAATPRSAPEYGEEPPSEREVRDIPAPQGRGRRRMVSLTLLDGTTITLPARNPKSGRQGSRASSASEPAPAAAEDPGLTARDLVSALRAVSHGADASEILGNNVRWEAMFAALLSLLLKKHLIADWEFVDELKKI